MCGISGYITIGNAVKASNIKRINDAIQHRGPDDEGFVCVKEYAFESYSGQDTMPSIKLQYPQLNEDIVSNIALGFRRLSIVELSEKGHQPMLLENVCLTFNGEIYNYLSLKLALEQLGHQFNGHSDTEVILKAYLQWGIKMVNYLDGMFAIAIVDLRINQTFLIRDRLGIKPLFYHQSASDFTWCSEIKGILKADWVKASMSLDGLILNYEFKSSVPPHTCFENIFALPPAHILCIQHQSLKHEMFGYWNIPNNNEAKKDIPLEDAIAAVSKKLSYITQSQMQADVPVISMMSGGIDSTLITAMAHKHDPEMACYTLGIDGSGSGNDELPQAKKMAQSLGIKQLIHTVSEADFVETAIQNISHIEEPYNSLDVVFNASKFLQQNGYKVILSGNGADEVFGGYGYNLKLERWQKLKPFGSLASLMPNTSAKIKKLKYALTQKNIGQYFLSTTGGLRNYDIAALLENVSLEEIKSLTQPFIEKENFKTPYEGLFYYDLKYSVGAHHVFHDDICAMRYSVEMRYPYLDHELIEMVATLPVDFRFNGIENKPLLRKIAQQYITTDNLQMPKKGFALPIDIAMKTNKTLQNFVDEQISYLKKTGIFDNKTIDRIVAEGKQKDYYLYTYQLVSTAVWMQTYL